MRGGREQMADVRGQSVERRWNEAASGAWTASGPYEDPIAVSSGARRMRRGDKTWKLETGDERSNAETSSSSKVRFWRAVKDPGG